MTISQSLFRSITGLLLLGTIGCASGPYQYGRGWHYDAQTCCPAPNSYQQVEVVHGRPNKWVDGAGWIIGIESKLLLWDRRASNHDVSPETTASVVNYLEQNGLNDVCVRVNQYDPVGEWNRLRENDEIPAAWRYTFGTMTVLQYAVLPGRLTGRDKYNPFTNSVYLFSDIPSLGIQSAAYAKDIHQRDYVGTYAAVNTLPVIALWHETIATNDSLNYYGATGSTDDVQEGRRILYPHYGMCVGGSADMIVGLGPIFEVAGAIAGHMTNRASNTSPAQPSQTSEIPPAPASDTVTHQEGTGTISPTSGLQSRGW